MIICDVIFGMIRPSPHSRVITKKARSKMSVSMTCNKLCDWMAWFLFFWLGSIIFLDMEWLKGDDAHDMEVDIGYMEQMELRSTGPSRPANYEGYR